MATQVGAWQGGTSTVDVLNLIAMGPDRSSILAGYNFRGFDDSSSLGTQWAAVKLDVDGTVQWTLEDGVECYEDCRIEAAFMDEDGCVVFAGSDGRDFHVIKLDADGYLVWHFEDGTNGTDVATGITMGDDGSVVVAGQTDGFWDIPNLGDGDMAAFKLDFDGTLLWRWQGGTDKSDSAHVVVMGDDESVFLAGVSGGDFTGVDANVSHTSDLWVMAAIKLDPKGTEVWRWQDVPGHGYPAVLAGSLAKDGSFVIAARAGSTREGMLDAVMLDADGNEVWRWQNGSSEDEEFFALAVLADWTIVLSDSQQGTWSGAHLIHDAFIIVALKADGEKIWRWQGGSAGSGDESGYDGIKAMATFCDGLLLSATVTLVSWMDTTIEQDNYAVVMVDAGAPARSLQPEASPPSLSQTQASTASTATATSSSVKSSELGPLALVVTPPAAAETTLSSGARSLQLATPSPTHLSGSGTSLTNAPTSAEIISPATSAASTTSPARDSGVFTFSPTRADVMSPPTAASATPSPREEAITMPPTRAEVISPATSAGATLSPSRETSIATPSPSGDRSGDPKTFAPGAATPTAPFAAMTASPAAARDLDATGAPVNIQTPAGTEFSTLRPSVTFDVTPAPPRLGSGSTSTVTGVASAVTGFALIIFGVLLWKLHVARKMRANSQSPLPVVVAGEGFVPQSVSKRMVEAAVENTHGVGGTGQSLPEAGAAQPAGEPAASTHKDGGGAGAVRGVAVVKGYSDPAQHVDNDGGGGSDAGSRFAGSDAEHNSLAPAFNVSTSTTNISKGEKNQGSPILDEIEPMASTGRQGALANLGLSRAVGDAADDLARHCHIPGVSEAAAALSILVNMVSNKRDNNNGMETNLRRCRAIVLMLQRAEKVLGKGGDTAGKAERSMMEDVHDAILDLVELMKTYQSKNKLSQLLVSTMFRRRQDEMGAVVDRAIIGLQLGLHVQYGNDVGALNEDVSAVKQDVCAIRDGLHLHQSSIGEALSKSLAEARTARRQRKLNQIEIPEKHVIITDELLGTGGFGEVFLADYNGRNAAVKVMHIGHELGRRLGNDVLDGSLVGHRIRERVKDQRKAFLRELEAMIRLRSPFTVNVYGAITSMPDRLVLVMELLSGGDLRTMLGKCDTPLSERQARMIIGDICAGMAFLHSKEAVHGDLKSANVLLDATSRAKIGDFGTSRWTQHTMSTGLATFTTKSSQNTQLSLAWSAPEVLDDPGSTYASDVYSFGIVVWEVLSRKLPWATESHPRNIYIRVALKGQRPVIPDDAPTEIANIAKVCWAKEPGDRPTFSAVLKQMKSSGWNE